MEIKNDAALVIEHASKKQKTTFYWKLLRSLVDSKKSPETKLVFYKDEDLKSGYIRNFSVRIKNSQGLTRRGQLDFYLLTEDGKFLDMDFFYEYKGPSTEQFTFFRYSKSHMRYYLLDLQRDLSKINSELKLVYLILIPSKNYIPVVFSLDRFNKLIISDASAIIEDYEEIIDDIDEKENLEYYHEEIRWKKIYERRALGEIIHICPNCENEWNNYHCHCCGHPH